MSLNWKIDDIKDYKEVCWLEDGKLNPVTEVLVFGTISVGLGSITDKNVDEFAARFRIIEKVYGAMLYKPNPDGSGRVDWLLSDEDFIAHIGLSTNVSNETRSKWASRLFVAQQTSMTEDFARNFRRAQKVTA